MLCGRSSELERLRELIARAASGESSTTCVHGDAGTGKTALLREAVAGLDATTTVLRARGVESEAELAYAGLAELLAPILHLREGLPPAQASALGAALAIEEAPPPAPFSVAAGVLSILAAAADQRPVVVVADDLQWLDEASRAALLFAARRLHVDAVAVLLGIRDGEGLDPTELDVEAIALGGLAEEDARALLAATHPDLAVPVVARLVTATRGVPLALVEIPRLLTAEQRAGDAALQEPLPLGRELERAFRRRIAALDRDARRAFLLVACAEEGDEAAVAAALRSAGLEGAPLAAGEATGLLTTEAGRIELRHPLARSAALRAAAPEERRAAHRALADAEHGDGTRRAWHLAAASPGPDAEAATLLAQAGAVARERGAFAEAGTAFERASTLATESGEQARLLLEAAGALVVGGHPARGLELTAQGERIARDPVVALDLRATAARARIRMGEPQVAGEALVAEADRLADDPARQAVFLLEAAAADMASGSLRRMIERAGRAEAIAADTLPPLSGLATMIIAEARLALGESAAGDATLEAGRESLMSFVPGSGPSEIVGMAAHSSMWVERFDRAETILTRLIGVLREAGTVTELVYPLAVRAQLQFRLGRWPGALADATEAVRLGEDSRQDSLLAHACGVLAEIEAGLGREADCRVHAARGARIAEGMGAPATAAYAHGALALLALGRGDPQEAAEHGRAAEAATAATDSDEPGIVRYAPDLAEALWRTGEVDAALDQIAELERQADRPGHSWTAAVAARLRGLAGDDEDVDARFEAALALHDLTHQPFDTARTRLLHGERLRRARRPTDARRPLRAALAAFERLGAEPWAERSRTELRAAGGPTGGAAPASATDALTPQELQIALLAAQGQTNREIGAGLFLSPKTVEHHLSRSFRKLGLRRRSELAGAMAAP